MILLQWSWTLRFEPYARATFATQPILVALPLVAGVVAGFVVQDDFGLFGATLYGFFVLCLLAVVLLVVVALGLRRLRRATDATVQRYVITDQAVEIFLGDDRYSLPRPDLSVARSASDWVALRRRAMGGRRLILFFDDPLLVPHALSVLGHPAGPVRS